MKTPMQEHIEFLKKEWKKLVVEGQLGVALHIGDCIKHAESMLEKEKEVIVRSFMNVSDDKDTRLEDVHLREFAEDYYNKTFNTKLTQDTDGCSNDRSKCSCKDWGGCPVD